MHHCSIVMTEKRKWHSSSIINEQDFNLLHFAITNTSNIYFFIYFLFYFSFIYFIYFFIYFFILFHCALHTPSKKEFYIARNFDKVQVTVHGDFIPLCVSLVSDCHSRLVLSCQYNHSSQVLRRIPFLNYSCWLS